ncbi:MAG: response regulator [Chloroflexi bacterium]|nr:response regulator [Chloroflexota bacterium]
MNKIRKNILEGWKVVVVDDEADSLEVATRILRFYGANVSTASNGREGVEIITRTRPRFVITDLSMPELDGWGLLYELRQDTRTIDIPVFALTAHAMIGDRERAMAAGFHNYLTKPLSPATFMEELLAIMETVPALEQLIQY